MSNIIEKDGRRASHCPGKIKVTDSMSIPWVMRNHAIDRAEKVVFERKSSINTWVPVTWRQFYAEVRELARGLIAMGVQPNDHIAIMSHSRYEFALFDQAVWAVGAQLIPIYETDSTQQARWIIDDAHCRIAIAETRQLHDVLAPILNDVEHFETIHVIEEDAVDKISALGQPESDEEIDRRIDATTADDLATIIYTSGTTGLPKGARLSHRNLLHVAINGPLDDGLSHIIGGYQRSLLALPMAHVFARFICIMSMYSGNVTGFAPDAKNLVTDIQSFKPTYILAVPRIFEKIYNAADAKAGRGLKLKLFRHYAKVAIKYSRALDTPEGPSLQLRAQHRAGDRLVYSTIRNLLGGDLANSISGGAPLGERLGHFFRGIGITVHEGYGLTETSAPPTVTTPHFIRRGSVGPAYAGCYVSLGEDGEILCKGDHVFREYNNNPEATAEAFTEDGWFHTGDLGRIDDDGFVYITGRKKELIVTAGGKNVAPAILEDRLRGHPLVSQVVVVGDQKPFIGALATLDSEMLPGWLRNHGLPEMSAMEAAENPQVLAAIDRALQRANEAVSRAESIRKFRILPIDFTVANGYMTPSMKLKRAAVLRDFADDIEKIYATD